MTEKPKEKIVKVRYLSFGDKTWICIVLGWLSLMIVIIPFIALQDKELNNQYFLGLTVEEREAIRLAELEEKEIEEVAKEQTEKERIIAEGESIKFWNSFILQAFSPGGLFMLFIGVMYVILYNAIKRIGRGW